MRDRAAVPVPACRTHARCCVAAAIAPPISRASARRSCVRGQPRRGAPAVNPLPPEAVDPLPHGGRPVAAGDASQRSTRRGAAAAHLRQREGNAMQDQGWPVPDAPGFLAAWQAAVADDALLRRRARHAAVRFAFESGGATAGFAFNAPPGAAAFTVAAPAEAWAQGAAAGAAAAPSQPVRHAHARPGLRAARARSWPSSSTATWRGGCWRSAAGSPPAMPRRCRTACARWLAEPAPAEITGRYLPVAAGRHRLAHPCRAGGGRPRPALPAHRRRRWRGSSIG